MQARAPDGAELAAACRALERRAGLSMAPGLEATLRQALAGAGRELGLTLAALVAALEAGDEAVSDLLVEHAVVVETSFWRHPEGLLAVAARLASHPVPALVWSAGCATGEEPLSLAMALLEAGRSGLGDRILATDVSARALQGARAGRYRPRALRRLPTSLAARWFHQADHGASVDERAAALVTFQRHNLLDDPPAGRFDAILCRNVLIYFEPEVAAATLRRLAGALAPGGLLLVGPVELPLAAGLGLERLEDGGALLRRP